MRSIPSFLVAGTHSGVGKTTATLALMALFSKKGYRVQPFKIGPDFIDGGYHRLGTGRDSINLDPWMMGWKGLNDSFRSYGRGADLSVIEGMGALYDGKNGTVSGSSAEIAKRLKVPVLLIVDIWGMTVTTGAVLEGLQVFDPSLKIAAILFNRAGSRGHFEMVLKSLKPIFRKKVIGYLPYSGSFAVPERHLGLKTLQENNKAQRIKKALVETADRTLDLKVLSQHLGLRKKGPRKTHAGLRTATKVRIGIAKDEAFCFYYAENLRMLQEAGARLVPFDPMRDPDLPPGLDGLYIGGGYPESFTKELSANRDLRRKILLKIREGMPVYAECGGLMYLSKDLRDFFGRTFPMVSALPLRIKMEKEHLTIRYVEVRTMRDSLLGPRGTVARGQEFHQSRIVFNAFNGDPLYRVVTSTGQKFTEGFQKRNLLASYIHLHFRSDPRIPKAFVQKCLDHRKSPHGQ